MIKLAKLMRKKPGDKGFTLIELIIVIAILAALIAILAPQYLKYVEKSRKTADDTTAAEILSACKIAAADPEVTLADGDYTIIWNGATTLTYGGSPDSTFQTAVTNAVGALPAIKSSTYSKEQYKVSISLSSGTVTADGIWENKPAT